MSGVHDQPTVDTYGKINTQYIKDNVYIRYDFEMFVRRLFDGRDGNGLLK